MSNNSRGGVPDIVHTTLRGVTRFDTFENLYTEPQYALLELKRRRKDAELKRAVRKEFMGKSLDIFRRFSQPRAVFFRQVATPNHETLRFLEFAKELKLKPLILEYHDDKFVSSENRSKRSLGKLPIYQYTGKDGRDMVVYQTVCDFNAHAGKKLRDVTCHSGESLISLHHKMFKHLTRVNPKTYSFDASAWFHQAGNNAQTYYLKLLMLFIRDGILFENFMPHRSEIAFTKSVVIPAFHEVHRRFGIRPLIVQLIPDDQETRQFWDSYPKTAVDRL